MSYEGNNQRKNIFPSYSQASLLLRTELPFLKTFTKPRPWPTNFQPMEAAIPLETFKINQKKKQTYMK